MNIENYAPAFVKAYYQHVLTSPRDVKKFYSNDSTYYRPYMNSNLPETFNPDRVCPHISQDSTITIKNFISSKIHKSSLVSLSVAGSVQSRRKSFCFNQNFVLSEIGGRIFIISDIFNEFNENDFKQTDEQSNANTTTSTLPSNSNTNTSTNSNNSTNTNSNNNTNSSPNANVNTNNRNSQRKNRNIKKNSFVYTPD